MWGIRQLPLWAVWLGALEVGCLGRHDTVLQPDPTNESRIAEMPLRMSTVLAPQAAAAERGGTAAQAGERAPVMQASVAAAGSAGVAPITSSSGEAPRAGMGGAGVGGVSPGSAAPSAGSAGVMPPASTMPNDPDCDLTGVWIAKQVTVSEALGVPQSSNNWYYLELAQAGTQVTIAKHFDCGIEVRGTVTVTLPKRSLAAQLSQNVQVGRKGRIQHDGDNCTFEMERFWSVRGAEAERFLPAMGRASMESIPDVAKARPLPTAMKPDGTLDPDGDGKQGIAFEISGLISGTRNSVQRDWSRWFTDPGYEMRASASWSSDLTIRADFDNEESVIDPSDGLLSSGSTPRRGARHVLKLHFLGRDTTDARVATIVRGDPVDTCYAIQDALPAEVLE